MRFKVLLIPVLAAVVAFSVASCNETVSKQDKAAEEVRAAKEEADMAYQTYLEEVENYKAISAERIANNKKAIADYNASVQASKKKMSEEQARMIADLEARNEALQKKLDAYKAEDQSKWQSFKDEFGRDMDQLGNSFKDLTVNNVK
jgi:hypothetical protein